MNQRTEALLEAPFLWFFFATNYLRVFWRRLCSAPSSIFPLNKLAEEAFAEAWLSFPTRELRGTPLEPTIELLGSASGVVLDLGPGSGSQNRLMSSDKITVIYGAEPAESFHEALEKAAIKYGFDGKYHVLPCGGEPNSLLPTLVERGILKSEQGSEIFDTIISSKVLCSIPHQKETIAALYSLLKPGGRILVVEHTKNKWREPGGSVFARLAQLFFTAVGWSYFLAGCKLNCDTIENLKKEGAKYGGWAHVDLQCTRPYGSVPFVIGTFTKKN